MRDRLSRVEIFLFYRERTQMDGVSQKTYEGVSQEEALAIVRNYRKIRADERVKRSRGLPFRRHSFTQAEYTIVNEYQKSRANAKPTSAGVVAQPHSGRARSDPVRPFTCVSNVRVSFD